MIIQVAIDGPAGAGKSTVAKNVARRIGVPYVDTGAIYRSLTWQAIRLGIPLDNEHALAELAQGLEILFIPDEPSQKVIVRGVEITHAIREPEISANVSQVATFPLVREKLLVIQTAFTKGTLGVVMDGRDIGTRIMPNADVKVFLTASIAVRAKRRFAELQRQGFAVDLTTVMQELEERDFVDRNRHASPLRPAEDAVQLDTSLLSIEESCAMVVALCEVRQEHKGVE